MIKIKFFLFGHMWQSQLIFSGGRNTHHEIIQCVKRRKSKTTFTGTRNQWLAHIGYDNEH